MFDMTKWYLDLVTDLGTVLVGYAIDCRIGPASVRYASLLHAPPDQPATERTTLGGARLPVLHGDLLHWHIPTLHFEGSWHRLGTPIEQTLLDVELGRIEWHCHLPRARVTARLGDTVLTGLGYAEQLRITCPPWQLPFRTLRWGRYVSAQHGLTWIEWAGDHSRRWSWSDGHEEPAATLHTHGISGLSDRRDLSFEDRRIVRDRQVLESVGRMLPDAIRDRFGPLAGMREQKWLTRSVLRQEGVVVDRGWTIHEEVHW
jgi:hypothetical protein